MWHEVKNPETRPEKKKVKVNQVIWLDTAGFSDKPTKKVQLKKQEVVEVKQFYY